MSDVIGKVIEEMQWEHRFGCNELPDRKKISDIISDVQAFLFPAFCGCGCMSERMLLETLIGQFLQALSPRDRGVFLRRYFYMESCRDIAVRYGMKEANVRLCLSRTRQKLREILREEDFPL